MDNGSDPSPAAPARAAGLRGRTALVTGAAGGIGAAVVRRFLAEGARVVAFDRAPAGPADDDRLARLQGDVRDAPDLARAVALAVDRFGGLDVLVANAGIYDGRRALRSLTADQLGAAFDELFAVNVKGVLLAAHAAAGALAARRGSIVVTGSISGSRAGFGGALYVASKHAVEGLVRQLALELAPDVRVNAVAPGYVPTGLAGPAAWGDDASAPTPGPDPASLPLRTLTTPDDLADAYVFLAAHARTVTGTVVTVDAGSLLRGPRA